MCVQVPFRVPSAPIDLPGTLPNRLVFVHGFAQTAGVWTEVAELLNGLGHPVRAIDLPGHDQSLNEPPHTWDETVQEVLRRGGRGIYIGYSLGARLVLGAVTQKAPQIQAAMVFGARLGFPNTAAGAQAAQQRINDDEELAGRIETNGMESFLDYWLALDFNQRIPPERHFRELRHALQPKGLAASLRSCGYGRQPDQRSELEHISIPLAWVVGENDLASVQSDALEAAEAAPGLQSITIPGAGHSTPFEPAADEVAKIVDDYARTFI
jgi:2-succinyl-6-hydroxy-2,4-cyclohexadiene-1-carboxylate synthase